MNMHFYRDCWKDLKQQEIGRDIFNMGEVRKFSENQKWKYWQAGENFGRKHWQYVIVKFKAKISRIFFLPNFSAFRGFP